MAKNKKQEENFEEDFLIEMTDEEGNAYYYAEEMIIPVDGEKFALLIEVDPEDENYFDEDDEGDVIIAKIVTNEKGEEEYIEPTEEEFEKVQKVYDQLMEEEI